jgi:hypothetical protein
MMNSRRMLFARDKTDARRILMETPEGQKQILEYFRNFSITSYIYVHVKKTEITAVGDPPH